MAAPKKGIRINELAKELGIESKWILTKLREEGFGDAAPNHQTSISLGLAETVREWHSSGQLVPKRDEAVEVSSLGDGPALADTLGFTPYVHAVGAFLLSPKTRPPLTMSIEGEWGSGKSSFMLQLRRFLETSSVCRRHDEPDATDEQPDDAAAYDTCLTFEFNPWRHDKEEAIWAAFAVSFVRETRSNLSFWRRTKADWELFRTRFRWRDGWADFLLKLLRPAGIAVIVALIVSVAYVWGPKTATDAQGPGALAAALTQTGFQLGWATAAVLLVAQVVKGIRIVLSGIPVADLKKHLKQPDYEGRAAFVEQFHEHFSDVVRAYAGHVAKVFIFVDDLDRCEVPKAANLMQAINLMIGDDRRLVFVLGLDRAKVAAGVAVKFKEVIPYLREAAEERGEGSKERAGLNFAYSYMEKFIQLPFHVPMPGRQIENFVSNISRPPAAWSTREGGDSSRQLDAALINSVPQGNAAEMNSIELTSGAHRQQRRVTAMRLDGDGDTMREVTALVARFLDNNPRRIKQFLNVFRLQAYIANQTGLFDVIEGRRVLTLPQLGKFVAATLRFPDLLLDLADEPGLIERLVDRVRPGGAADTKVVDSEALRRWLARNDLIELFLERPTPLKNPASDYDMHSISVRILLEISPQVSRRQADWDDSGARDVRHRPSADIATKTGEVAADPIDALGGFVRDYEETRKRMSGGAARTGRMHEIVDGACRVAQSAGIDDSHLTTLFNTGTPGGRAISLGVFRKWSRTAPNRALHALTEIVAGIGNAVSPFEQYLALDAASGLAHLMDASQASRVVQAIRDRMGEGPGVRITQDDQSRWVLARHILESIEMGEKTGTPTYP